MAKQNKSLTIASKYLIGVGILLYILTPFIVTLGTPILSSWLSCSPTYYGDVLVLCHSQILIPSLVTIFVPLVIGSILILIAISLKSRAMSEAMKTTINKYPAGTITLNWTMNTKVHITPKLLILAGLLLELVYEFMVPGFDLIYKTGKFTPDNVYTSDVYYGSYIPVIVFGLIITLGFIRIKKNSKTPIKYVFNLLTALIVLLLAILFYWILSEFFSLVYHLP